MTPTAILLVLLSATMHAGWNIFSKKRSPSIGFFMLATWGTILWFSPILVITAELIVRIPVKLWALLVVSGFFQAMYYSGLAGAYSRGALSIAYPLARSLPAILVVILSFMAGRGDELSSAALLGIAGIVTGALILPMDHFHDFKVSHYLNLSCLLAVIAAIGTAGYSFMDDVGMDMLTLIPATAKDWQRALLFLVLECLSTVFWLQLLMGFTRISIREFRQKRAELIKPALFAGLAIGATYGIILLAMTHATNVSYIVALRQVSIPIGTLLGIFILKENNSLPRVVGVTILFAGLVLVALG